MDETSQTSRTKFCIEIKEIPSNHSFVKTFFILRKKTGNIAMIKMILYTHKTK